MARLAGISRNLNSFLDMIAFSEGTLGHGDDGYNLIVGYSTFSDYSKHPNIVVNLGRGLKSTAAGRYQTLYRIWVAYKKQLGLRDFCPESQDRIAIQLIKECRALDLVENGNISRAIVQCSSRWASLPGNDYGQRQNGIPILLAKFNRGLQA